MSHSDYANYMKRGGAVLALAVSLIATLATSVALAADAADDEKRDRELLAAKSDAAVVKKGKKTYVSLCQSCHGDEKVTGDAPSNLFDAKWYHGARPAEIERSVLNGFPDKGMMAWKDLLPAADLTAVTAYLLSFQKN